MEREKITLSIPSEILPLVAKKTSDIPSRVFEYLILELYRLGEISSGKAAEYLEMGRFEFVRFASRLGIPFIDMEKEEVAKDYNHAHQAVKR
jgi:predicted HTH domain antitoxin